MSPSRGETQVAEGQAAFPFGVSPEGATQAGSGEADGRGADTMNRLLSHGARHHARSELFLHWGQGRRGWGWQSTPDWRADRHSIRVALVLRQRMQVAEGERVALWLPLGPEWALIERAVWSIGAVSVPIWAEWEPERVVAVLADAAPEVLFTPDLGAVEALRAIGGLPPSIQASVPLRAPSESGDDWISFGKLMEYGGVLDTPERASMWRAFARAVEPGAAACWEYPAAAEPDTPGESAGAGERTELDHRALVSAATRVARRFPPREGRVQLLAAERPELLLRAMVCSAWADGLTRTAFAPSRAARQRAGELRPALLACPGEAVAPLLEALEAGPRQAEEPRRGGLLGRLRGIGGRRRAGNGAGGEEARPVVVVTDGPADAVRGGVRGGRARVVAAAELGASPGGSSAGREAGGRRDGGGAE